MHVVKSILQGGSSSVREQTQLHHETHYRDVQRQQLDDKSKHKKRNILEVFKKPSNAKEIGKPAQKRTAIIDKFELECMEIWKVIVTIDNIHWIMNISY